MSLTLYGIPNCDTVRKARRWLEDQALPYAFHDFRADGLATGLVADWVAQVGWEQVLNRRSTSWKALSAAEREAMDAEAAVRAALASPTLIKRPVLVGPDLLEFGFSPARYAALLG